MEMTTTTSPARPTVTAGEVIFAAACIEVMGMPTPETGRILATASNDELAAAKTAPAAVAARPGSAAAIHGPEALDFIERIINARLNVIEIRDPRG